MNKKWLKFIKYSILPCMIIIIIIVGYIKQRSMFTVYVPTGAMYPTVKAEDHLIVNKIDNEDNLKRGDIVILKSKELNDTLIKRLIGLPGDDILISDGKVTINGDVLEESYVENNDISYSKSFKVPEGKYFFLGDNRRISSDSRQWKNPYISGEDIIGKAEMIIYPFKDAKSLKTIR